jgi:NADH-quinone oxidoreductase subunit A
MPCSRLSRCWESAVEPRGESRVYQNVLIMFLAAGFIGAAALLTGALLGPRKASETKLAAYESGVPALGNARERFPVHFYLVAMLFIIFDIETAFFFPLAVKFGAAPEFLFVQAIIFVLILAVGYLYILKKGVLNWK